MSWLHFCLRCLGCPPLPYVILEDETDEEREEAPLLPAVVGKPKDMTMVRRPAATATTAAATTTGTEAAGWDLV